MIFPTPPQRPVNLKTYVPMIRLVHLCILVAALLQLYILYTLRKANPPQQPPLQPAVAYSIVLVGIVSFALILRLRRSLLEKAITALHADPTDSAATQRWGGAMLVTSCACESAFLFGWVLCFIGTPHTWTYILLWSIAAIGFVIFIPQMPIDEMTLIQRNPPPGP